MSDTAFPGTYAPDCRSSIRCWRVVSSPHPPLPPIQTPCSAAAAGDVEKDKTVQHGHFAFIDPGEEVLPQPELPMKLEIRHGHFPAAQERQQARLKSRHHR